MKSVRKWIRDIFGFSGNEINGFLILIPLMLLLVCSEPLYHAWVVRTPGDSTQGSIQPDSLLPGWHLPIHHEKPTPLRTEVALFSFDPNKASVSDLRRLGFSEILANRIAAYRRKGGVFSVKSDLLNIYGIDSTLYKQLYGYIGLPSRSAPVTGKASAKNFPTSGTWKKQEVKEFDINTADTLVLKSIYGIGSRLAARIIKFRDGLGGFIAPRQLYEVYGLDSAVVTRLLNVGFIQGDFVPKQININTADEKTLSSHPYIRYRLARLLVNYRFQHGDFKDVNDIKKLSAIESADLERLLPYLKTSD